MAQIPLRADLVGDGVSKLKNIPAASAAGEVVVYEQFNAAIEGVAWKDSCRVATQANLNLASPGASIDGVTMTTGDRVLVRAQTTAAENGIYVWNGAAVTMTRAADASTSDELEQAVTTIEEGTSAGTSYRQTAVNFTLESGAVNWTTFGSSAGAASETSAGIAEIATQTETDTGTDDQRFVTPAKIAAWPGRKRKLTQAIGDGSAMQYDVTHNFGTRDLHVQVRQTNSPYSLVWVETQMLDTNTVRLIFNTAPTSNQFTVIVLS